MENARQVERIAHNLLCLEGKRVENEWFRVDGDRAIEVIQEAVTIARS
jgi:hypothetical protein